MHVQYCKPNHPCNRINLKTKCRLSITSTVRIYSIKHLPRINAADGSKITIKRRPRINAAPNQKNVAFIRAMLQSQLDNLNEPETNPFESNGTSSDVAEAYPTLQLLNSDHEGDSDIESNCCQ